MTSLIRAGLALAVGLLSTDAATGAPTDSYRYPFDPTCPWGRVSDGRGMLVRCISAEEAQRLLSTPPATTPPTTPAPQPSNTPTTTAAGTGGSSNAKTEELVAELFSVTADEGQLPLAQKKLGVPLDRYQNCVKSNGGLLATSAEVQVKFLVRERGRAEGATAEKFQGMTEAAAQCIADVVDRRPTGAPEAPVVGATAIIRIKRKANR